MWSSIPGPNLGQARPFVIFPAPAIFRRSGVVKEVLLGVPTMFAEVFLGKLPQPRRGKFPGARKILSTQHPLDPDIDREGSQSFVGEKHHAISNLHTDTG